MFIAGECGSRGAASGVESAKARRDKPCGFNATVSAKADGPADGDGNTRFDGGSGYEHGDAHPDETGHVARAPGSYSRR